MTAPGLPHHRRGPRIDERRTDPEDATIQKAAVAMALAMLLALVAIFAAGGA